MKERKTYIPPKGEAKKEVKDPNTPKRPPLAFFLFYSENCPIIKGEHPSLSIGDTARSWERCRITLQADEKKAAKLKEKYRKEIAAYRAQGEPGAAKKDVVKAEKSKKNKKEEEDDDKEGDDDESVGSSAVFSPCLYLLYIPYYF
uniref:HMG box domain-containing protein n=1 Tax=Molossus molossus TaxID=27622 RepID=A0A7J8J8I8_MOLMO|nr:hypothetical protein HJG59_009664 [Molossus molossus]